LNNNPNQAYTRSIQGQVLRLSPRRMAVIFLHDGSLWVADFIDCQGELIDAATWFRFNCGSLSSSQARRRMVLESATPISAELVDRIETLRRPALVPEGVARVRMVEAIAGYVTQIRRAATSACRHGRLRTRSVKRAIFR
jgi:hypothetical protein